MCSPNRPNISVQFRHPFQEFKEFAFSLLKSNVASHVVEVALEVCSKDQLTQIYEHYFRQEILSLCKHTAANHTVQALLKKISEVIYLFLSIGRGLLLFSFLLFGKKGGETSGMVQSILAIVQYVIPHDLAMKFFLRTSFKKKKNNCIKTCECLKHIYAISLFSYSLSLVFRNRCSSLFIRR